MKDKIKYVELVERLKRDIDLPEGVDDVFLVKAFFDKNPKAAEGVDMEDVTIPERYDVGTMAKIIRHEVGKFDGTDEELVNLFLEKNPSYKDQVDLKKKDFNIYEATQEGLGYIGGKKETEKRSNDPIGYIQEDIDKLVKEKDRLERKSIVTSTKDIAWSRSIYTGDKKFSSSDDAVEYERINKKILELEDQKRKLEVQIERKRLDNKYAPHYESYKEYIKNVPDDIDVLKNEKERELKDIAKSGAGYKEFVYGRTMYAYKPTPILEDEESRKRYDQLQREVKELDALKSLRMEDAYALSTDLDAESRQELRYYIKQRVEEDEVKRQANKLFREKYPDKLYPDEAVEKFTIEVERLFADASRLKGELLNKAKVSKSQFDLEMKELDASIEAELLQKKAELEQMYDAGAISVDDANRQLEELRKNKTLIYNEHIRRYNSNVIDALNNAHISLFDTFKGKLSDLEREYGVTIDGKLSKDVVDRYEDVFAEVYAERQRFSMAKWNALPRSAQIAMSFSAGVLDLFNSIGGGLNWLGYYEAGNYLSDMAMDFYKSADIPVFELDKLLTPDWWIANGVRTLPFTLSLLPTGYGVTLGLSSALARTAMPVLLRQLVAGAGGALINRPIEGWFNAGGSFNEAMEMGMSVEQASQVAADVMKNEAFLYFNDAMQLGLAFTPAKGFLSKLLLFLYEGASEGIEELLQGYWQHNAIARRDDETPILSLMEYAKTDMALTEMILGTATGLAFQGGAETIKYIAGMKNIDADKFAEDKITNYMITNFFSDEESNVPLEKRRDDAFNMIDVFMERGSLTEEQADYHKKMTNYAYELKVSGLGFDEDTRVALLEYYGNILASELLLSKLGDKNIDAAISEKLNRQRADLQKMLSGEIAIYMINESIISNEQFKKFIDDPLFIEKFVNDNIKVKVVNSDLTLMDKLAQRADEFTKYKQQQAEQQAEQQTEQQTEQQAQQSAQKEVEETAEKINQEQQNKKEIETQIADIERRRQEAKENPVPEPISYKEAVEEYKSTDLGSNEDAKRKKQRVVNEAQTKEGRAFVENQVAQLETNDDGTITVYRSGTMQEGHNPATTDKKIAEVIASERKKQGLSSDIIEVRVQPTDISAVIPGIESEVFIEVNADNKNRISDSTKKPQKTKNQIIKEKENVKIELDEVKQKLLNLNKDFKNGKLPFSEEVYNETKTRQEQKIKNLEWQLTKYDAELAALKQTNEEQQTEQQTEQQAQQSAQKEVEETAEKINQEQQNKKEIETQIADIERRRQEEIDNLFSRTQASTDKQLNTPVQKLSKEQVNKNIEIAKQQNKDLIEELENPEFLNDEKRNDEWDKKADELSYKLPQGVSFRITDGKVDFFDNQSYREKGFGKKIVQVSVSNLHNQTEKFEVGDNLQVQDGVRAIPAIVTKVNEHGKILEAKDEDGKIIISRGNIITLAPINARLKINAKYDAELAALKQTNEEQQAEQQTEQQAEQQTEQQAEQQTEQQTEQQAEQQTEQQAEQQTELKTDEISTQPQKEVSTQPQLKKDEVIRDRAFIKRAKREGLTPIEMAKNNLKRIYDRFVKLGHEVVKDDEGKVTLGDAIKMFKRATGMSTKAISEVLKFATPDVKWHLTGNMQKKYGSGVGITNFINPNQIAYIANNWDEIVKDLALVKVKMRDAVKNRAEYKKKIDAFVKRNATYVERTKNASLDNFHVVKQEMKGVFGWFDSRGKNFKLAEYYSGWVFDSRDAYIEFVGMLNRYGSTYDGLSVSEDESGRYMSNPDAKYPEIPESKLGSTVKAIWSKGQAFKFTGSTCIGSAADVAYLMRLLEDAAVEHVFAVHIDENGNSFIQHVSVGGVSKAIVDAKIIAAGVKQFNSKMVYLIHNHPTGNVTPSNNDYFVTETIKKVLGDDVTVAHVIMDTYRMDYSVHYDRGSWSEHRRESKGRGVTMPYDYYMMDKYELLSYPYGNIGSVNDAVTFVQQMRFSAFPKLGMIVMNNSGDVIANYILGNTFDFNKAYHLASSTPTGSSVIFYGNNREVVKVVDEKYRFFIGQMYVRDYIVVDSNSSGVTGFYSTHEQFDITVSKAQSVYGTDSVYNHGEPDPYIVSESDSKDYDLRNWIDEDKLTNMELFKIEFPELVYLAKEFLSAEVIVGVLAANMWGRAIFSDKVRKIKLSKELFEKATYDDLSKVLGHEIGHIIDRLAKVKGSNLLGNIAGLMNYRETLLPESPGRSNILTDEDRKRLKKEAEKQIKEEAEKSMVEIVEEVVSKIPYYEDIGVSPKDIVDIWNNVDSDLRSRNPELYNYIASLDTKGKRAIVTKAMQGYVDEFIQRRYGRILKYKDIVEKIRKSIKTKPVTAEAISERFSELLREEINKRRLFELETIREELKTLSKWWKEFDEKLNPKYTKYRFSNRELYADALSVLFNAPHELAERAPFFNRAFFNYFGVRPEAKSGYEHLQTLLKDPNMVLAERSHRVRKGFEEARQKVLEQWNKSKKHKFGVASSFWMKYFSIIDVLIKNVPDVTSNYGKLTPRQKIQNAVEMIAFIDNEHFSLLDKITREVVLPLEMLGVDLDTFGEALTYIRIIEGRSDKAAPLGLQEMFSVEGLNFIREKMSVEVEKVFFDKIRLFHEYIHGALVKIQAESNMFSDKQMSIIFKNKYNYATFRDIKYVGNFVPAVIKPIKGTLNAIQNPFEATLAYVFALQRAARKTYAKNMTLEFLMKYDPLGVENAKRTRQGFIVKKDRYLLDFYEKGEHVGYYVDPYFEYIFEVVKDNDLASLTKLFKYFNKGFKPLVTEFNPGFAFMFNVLRDTNRAKVDLTSIVGDGKVIPIEESLRVRAHLVSHFLSSFKQGRGVYYGNIEPVINEMIDAGVFDIRTGISSNYNVSEQESVDIVASRLFPEVYNRKYKRWRELNEATKTLSAFGHLYRSTARGLELGTKINAYKFLRKSGFDIEAASFYARNIAGTPNWKRYGLHTVWLNQWSPFSNVTLQGLGMDLTLATKRKTAGGFWYSVIAGAVLPGILQGLLASGLFDERLRKIYDKIPNYHKYNFLCIPFDTTDDGAVRYFVLPFGEITRLFFSIGFAMSRVLADERPVGVRELKHIFNVGASYTLSIHPLIEIVHGWGQYLFGKSPTTYMGSDVVPSYMMAAGITWEGTKKMLLWTASTLGASWILTTVSYDPYENRFTEYGFKNVPILNRIYKETKAGELEKYWDLVSKVDKDRKVVGMREKLYLKKVVEEYGKQFTEMKIDLRDKDQVVEQRRHQRDFLDRKIKEYIGVDKITTAEQVDIYRRMFDTGHDYIYAGVHNEVVEVIRVFTYAPTLEAKCEVLNMFRRQEGEEAYQELLNYLKWQGRLSNDFFSTWHKMYGAEEKKRKEEAVKKEM